jgi:hypothetical protein
MSPACMPLSCGHGMPAFVLYQESCALERVFAVFVSVIINLVIPLHALSRASCLAPLGTFRVTWGRDGERLHDHCVLTQ